MDFSQRRTSTSSRQLRQTGKIPEEAIRTNERNA